MLMSVVKEKFRLLEKRKIKLTRKVTLSFLLKLFRFLGGGKDISGDEERRGEKRR